MKFLLFLLTQTAYPRDIRVYTCSVMEHFWIKSCIFFCTSCSWIIILGYYDCLSSSKANELDFMISQGPFAEFVFEI